MLRAAAAAATRAPTLDEPVKLTAATEELFSKGSPMTDPEPSKTLKTPAGRPAAAAVSAKSVPIWEAASAGFKTTVFPNARAGAAFQSGIASGKFQGVISATTPSGCRSENWSV